MNRAAFRQSAPKLTAEIHGQAAFVELEPKESALGPHWHGSGPVFVTVAGRPVRCRLTVRLTPEDARNWPDR